MFGENLEKFIENNIEFAHQGNRPNQKIYFNIEESKFIKINYCGNQTFSQDEDNNYIFIIDIKNYEDFTNNCSYCNGDENGNDCLKCKNWDECQAESLYDFIREHIDDDFGIRHQIESLLDNVHFNEIIELDLELEKEFGEYHKYLNKAFNNNYGVEQYIDPVIDGIIDYGFSVDMIHRLDAFNDKVYLYNECDYLATRYEHSENPKCRKIVALLQDCNILQALEVIKNN